MNKIGIYKITSPSGKIYIGQSWNIENRFSFYTQGGGKNQRKLKNSFLKYGVENHKFEIIHELPNDVEQCILDTYEILYISQYRECGVEMLNLQEGGKGGKHHKESKLKMTISKIGNKNSLGRITSDATKLKTSNSLKNKPKSIEHKINMRNKHNKPVMQFSKNNGLLKKFKSTLEVEEKLKIQNSHISECCNNKRKTAGGFIWKYES